MLCLSFVCDVPCLCSASWNLVFANSSGAERKDVREQTQSSAFRATLCFPKEPLPLYRVKMEHSLPLLYVCCILGPHRLRPMYVDLVKKARKGL